MVELSTSVCTGIIHYICFRFRFCRSGCWRKFACCSFYSLGNRSLEPVTGVLNSSCKECKWYLAVQIKALIYLKEKKKSAPQHLAGGGEFHFCLLRTYLGSWCSRYVLNCPDQTQKQREGRHSRELSIPQTRVGSCARSPASQETSDKFPHFPSAKWGRGYEYLPQKLLLGILPLLKSPGIRTLYGRTVVWGRGGVQT